MNDQFGFIVNGAIIVDESGFCEEHADMIIYKGDELGVNSVDEAINAGWYRWRVRGKTLFLQVNDVEVDRINRAISRLQEYVEFHSAVVDANGKILNERIFQ